MQGFKPGSMPAHKQKGGKIKGPGSGTSDSIKADIPKGSYIMPADSTQQIGPKALGELGEQVPVNVSNGEYQMPPEQVHAVGVQALNQMRDATHAPVNAGFKPQDGALYFADGGSPAEEKRRRLPGDPLAITYGDMMGRPGASPAPRAQQAAAATPSVSYSDLQRAPTIPQPTAQSPSGEINTATPARPSAQVAQPQVQAAVPGMAPDQAPQMAPVSFSSMQREPNIPRSGQPRQMPQGEPLSASGVVDGLQAAGQQAAAGIQGAADLAAQAGRGFVAGGQAMTDQAATAAGSAVDAASGALNYLNRGDPVRDAMGAIEGFVSRSSQQAREANYGGQPPAAPTTQQNAPATPPAAAPAAAQTPATPSAAGDQQAKPLAAQPAPAAPAPAQQPQQGPALGMRVSQTSAPEIKRIDNAPGLNSPLFTNLPTGRAGSEMQGGTVNTMPAAAFQSAGPAASREVSAALQAAAARGDWDAVRGFYQRDGGTWQGRTAEQDAADNQGPRGAAIGSSRYGFKFARRSEDRAADRALADRRARREEELSRDRLDIDRQRAEGEAQTRGFEVRGMERMEKLYQQLENATTPEERAAVTEQLRALSGKEAPNRFTVVPGGQEVTEQGMLRTVPSIVLNNQTGQPVDLSGRGAQALPPIAENPAVQKIMQNTALSREERAAQIRALGYK